MMLAQHYVRGNIELPEGMKLMKKFRLYDVTYGH